MFVAVGVVRVLLGGAAVVAVLAGAGPASARPISEFEGITLEVAEAKLDGFQLTVTVSYTCNSKARAPLSVDVEQQGVQFSDLTYDVTCDEKPRSWTVTPFGESWKGFKPGDAQVTMKLNEATGGSGTGIVQTKVVTLG
ncbi:hypothetical protein OG203_00495 [Nocardia sp. NBC_01499]|uniref:hypothetical protein n=1 Tax=Nocardia sp. NBC_01499 TaxID=2903597 RepID=UPI0038662CDF